MPLAKLAHINTMRFVSVRFVMPDGTRFNTLVPEAGRASGLYKFVCSFFESPYEHRNVQLFTTTHFIEPRKHVRSYMRSDRTLLVFVVCGCASAPSSPQKASEDTMASPNGLNKLCNNSSIGCLKNTC